MLREIELVFENCECFKVNCNIEFDIVEQTDISTSIDNVKISIPQKENAVHRPFGSSNNETTKFNRIEEYRDITQIHIDGKTYYPVWYEEDEYSWSQCNEYQKTYRCEMDNMNIIISSDNKERKSKHQQIIDLIQDYWGDDRELTFGKLIHFINCNLGEAHIFDSSDDDVIESLQKLIMEEIL